MKGVVCITSGANSVFSAVVPVAPDARKSAFRTEDPQTLFPLLCAIRVNTKIMIVYPKTIRQGRLRM